MDFSPTPNTWCFAITAFTVIPGTYGLGLVQCFALSVAFTSHLRTWPVTRWF
jgi:hypothetical protein